MEKRRGRDLISSGGNDQVRFFAGRSESGGLTAILRYVKSFLKACVGS